MDLTSDRNFVEIKENEEGLVDVRIGNQWYENYQPYYAVAFIISTLEQMLEDVLGGESVFVDEIPDSLNYLKNNHDVFELTGINPYIFQQFPDYQSTLL